MADNYSKLLSQYFSGKLNTMIRMRTIDLKHTNKPDENVGGGRAQNKKNNVNDDMLIKIEEDDLLCKWRHQFEMIEMWLNTFDDEHVEVMRAHYGPCRLSWDVVAFRCNIDRSTALRWRDEMTETLRSFNVLSGC